MQSSTLDRFYQRDSDTTFCLAQRLWAVVYAALVTEVGCTERNRRRPKGQCVGEAMIALAAAPVVFLSRRNLGEREKNERVRKGRGSIAGERDEYNNERSIDPIIHYRSSAVRGCGIYDGRTRRFRDSTELARPRLN